MLFHRLFYSLKPPHEITMSKFCLKMHQNKKNRGKGKWMEDI